ncbi:MAG: AzlC family ABC transporter permease [Eubacteriales bacterium]|nr:AzlC family ABC transporter permease [Eubacteriales bacterium]
MSQPGKQQETGVRAFLSQADVATGLANGLPIGLGYFAVSFAFGLLAVEGGLSAWVATVISLSNLTSAGQFAGLQLIFAHRPLVEIALTTVLINLRYMLMSLSLSQKLAPGTGLAQRLLIGFGVTDEIYAVSVSQPGLITTRYSLSLLLLPLLGWTGGTLTGALAGSVLPGSVRAALGIALYAMFVAIVMPTIRQSRPVAFVAAVAVCVSTVITLTPALTSLRGGWQIILATLIASALGAVLAPIQRDKSGQGEEAC